MILVVFIIGILAYSFMKKGKLIMRKFLIALFLLLSTPALADYTMIVPGAQEAVQVFGHRLLLQKWKNI